MPEPRRNGLNGCSATGPRRCSRRAEPANFLSLTAAEYSAVVRTAVETGKGRIPVVGAAGYGTRDAIRYAQETERLGADGILLLPPYLVEGPQEGLRAHITAVCRATKLGVIVYNRGNCRLQAETLARIAQDCPNLIGFKDGVGDVEQIVAVRRLLGDRVVMLNGMPTAETYARPFRALGMATYHRRPSISCRAPRSIFIARFTPVTSGLSTGS